MFRPGSGALVFHLLLLWEIGAQRPQELQHQALRGRRSDPAAGYTHNPEKLNARRFVTFTSITALAISVVICMMMPGAPGPAGPGVNVLRTPPAWSPEQEHVYPFEQYTRDLMLWALATDLQPHQLAPAVVLRLQGSAREVARELSPQELVNGGMVDGRQLDALSYLINGLQTRFAPLAEETALRAISELTGFSRRSGERTDELISRFLTVMHRARDRGQMAMNWQGIAWILLRAVGVNGNQLMQLLAPLRGRMPNSEAEFGHAKPPTGWAVAWKAPTTNPALG